MGFFHDLGSLLGEAASFKEDIVQAADDVKTTVNDTVGQMNDVRQDVVSSVKEPLESLKADFSSAADELKNDLNG
jgi:methyl-accepting chemotaxis protein